MTVFLTIVNSFKTASDSQKMEETIQTNVSLTGRIDSVTTRNAKMTESITELARLNYKLSSQIQRISGINLLKADTLINKADLVTEKAQGIINNATGGESFCIIDFVPLAGTDTASRYIVNVGIHPLRNLTVFAGQKEDNWSKYKTNTLIDDVKTIGTLYPGEIIKRSDMDESVFYGSVVESLAGFNYVPSRMSRTIKNVRNYKFLADNGFWSERFELFRSEEKWHKHITVIKNGKKVYDKTYIF